MCSELIETERDVMNEVNGREKNIYFPLGQEEALDPITLTLYSIYSKVFTCSRV